MDSVPADVGHPKILLHENTASIRADVSVYSTELHSNINVNVHNWTHLVEGSWTRGSVKEHSSLLETKTLDEGHEIPTYVLAAVGTVTVYIGISTLYGPSHLAIHESGTLYGKVAGPPSLGPPCPHNN